MKENNVTIHKFFIISSLIMLAMLVMFLGGNFMLHGVFFG